MRRRELPVATVAADLAGGAVIATGDAADLHRLASHADGVTVAPL